MCDETTNHGCCEPNPPWEPPQVIPAQMRRVNNLIFRKINQFHRENGVENVTPMHDWIMSCKMLVTVERVMENSRSMSRW